MSNQLKFNIRTLASCFILSMLSYTVYAQDIDLNNVDENLSKENRFKLNGGLNVGLIGYAGNSEATRNPFTWNVAGNLNVRLFDLVDVPVSLNISNANRELRVPNTPTRISISPTYKAFTAHIGDVNLVYSPYTLNGHQFTGGGVDILPAKGDIQISAMGGRMQQSVGFDSINPEAFSAYERWGYGGKIKLLKEDFDVGMNVFTAKDRLNSVLIPLDIIGVTPLQNLVGSIDLAIRPFDGFEFKGELALSALTSDIRDNSELAERSNGLYNNLYPINNSTAYYSAQNLSFAYEKKGNLVGLRYEKIDPGYRTLGAYFFANDLENITLNAGKTFMSNKLNVLMRAGLQRDDLDGQKSGRNTRFVGSANANYTPNEKFNISASYSNFQTYMRIKSQFQFINQVNQFQALDTFNFTQIAQNLSINSNYLLSDKDSTRQTISLNFSLQDAFAEQGGVEMVDAGNVFYNIGLSHIFQQGRVGIDIITSYYITTNTISVGQFITQGPALSIIKKLLKNKLRLNASVNYNNTTSSNALIPDVAVLNLRFSSSIIAKDKHNFMLSVMHQTRASVANQIGTLTYSFFF